MTAFSLIASIWDAHIWYAVPLGVVISLVYGATRHEEIPEILQHCWRAGVWVALFMAAIAAIVWVGGFGVT
jgi:hypothetical protein